MDSRVRNNLEGWIGIPIKETNNKAVLEISSRRTDEPYNRLVIHRNDEYATTFVTCIPRLYDSLSQTMNDLTSYELFSKYGMNQISKILSDEDATVLGQGFGYALTSLSEFHPINHSFDIRKIGDSMIFPIKYGCFINDVQTTFVDLYIRDDSGLVVIDVITDEKYREKGMGIATVSEAIKGLLHNNHAVYYGAVVENIPSLHIAHKLGFKLVSQHIVA